MSTKQALAAAESALSEGRFEQVAGYADLVLEREPRCARAYSLRGKAALTSLDGRDKDAIADFEKALELDPSVVDSYTDLGSLYFDFGKLKESERVLDQGIVRFPDHMTLYMIRAQTYSAMNKEKEAIDDLGRAMELSPRDGGLYFRRAALQVSFGDYDAALKDYDKALELYGRNNPDVTSEIRSRRARLLSKLGRHREAIAACTDLIGRSGGVDEDAYQLRAEQFMALDEYDNAIKDYSTVIERWPAFARSCLKGRSVAYLKVGRKEDAEADRQAAIKLHSQPAEKPIFELKDRDGR